MARRSHKLHMLVTACQPMALQITADKLQIQKLNILVITDELMSTT